MKKGKDRTYYVVIHNFELLLRFQLIISGGGGGSTGDHPDVELPGDVGWHLPGGHHPLFCDENLVQLKSTGRGESLPGTKARIRPMSCSVWWNNLTEVLLSASMSIMSWALLTTRPVSNAVSLSAVDLIKPDLYSTVKRCNTTSYPIARRLPVANFRPHPVNVDVELPGGELEQPAVLGVTVLANGRVRAHPQLSYSPRGKVLHNWLQGSVHRLGFMVTRDGEGTKPAFSTSP